MSFFSVWGTQYTSLIYLASLVPGILLGIAMFWIFSIKKNVQIRNDGIVTKGRIVQKFKRKGKDNDLIFKMEFILKDDISDQYYLYRNTKRYSVGGYLYDKYSVYDRLDIIYIPNNPHYNMLKDHNNSPYDGKCLLAVEIVFTFCMFAECAVISYQASDEYSLQRAIWTVSSGFQSF